MIDITTNVTWDLKEQDIANLKKEGLTDPYKAWNQILIELDSDSTLEISSSKEGKDNIKRVCLGVLEKYAKLQESEFKNTAEEHAAFIVGRMRRFYGSNAVVQKTLESPDFFTVEKGSEWVLGGRTTKFSSKDLGSGVMGTFAERAILGAGVATGNRSSAREADLREFDENYDVVPVSNVEAKAIEGASTNIGAITINIEKPWHHFSQTAPIYALDIPDSEKQAMIESILEQRTLIRQSLAELIDKDTSIREYIIGRTVGLLKLFEKLTAVLIFGVQVHKTEGKKDADRAIFRYTSAKVYAQLRYKEIVEQVKRTMGEDTFGLIGISTKIKGESFAKRQEMGNIKYLSLEININTHVGNLQESDLGGLTMSTNLYRSVYNIFANVEERIEFFKTMYQYQGSNIASNKEIQLLKDQMHSIQKR